jgi:gliding motility-associated-like protein
MEAAAQVFPMPTAMFSTDQSVVNMLNPVVQFNNESVGADLFFWQFSGNGISTLESPSFEFPAEAERGYEVCLEVVNEQGCADTFCSDVYVEGDWFVYVPSAFSPDKDGLNEVFQPVVTGINEDEYLFQVFNRWGIKVFETTDPEGFWDGSVENGDYYTQVDVYIWVVEAKDVYTADKHRFEGQVTVLR